MVEHHHVIMSHPVNPVKTSSQDLHDYQDLCKALMSGAK